MVSFLVERDSLTTTACSKSLWEIFFGPIMLVRSELSIKGLARLLNLQPPKLGRGPPAAWQGPDIKNSRLPDFPRRTTAPIPKFLNRITNQRI